MVDLVRVEYETARAAQLEREKRFVTLCFRAVLCLALLYAAYCVGRLRQFLAGPEVVVQESYEVPAGQPPLGRRSPARPPRS
jgi:hypothetical protein